MAYNATYDTDDFSDIVVDGLGTAGATAVDYVSLIILIAILGILAAGFVKLRKAFK